MTSSSSDSGRARHAARAIDTSHKAANVVRDMTGLDDVESALRALEIVAGGIVRRLPAREAKNLIDQLPSELGENLLDLPAGPDKNISLETIQAELSAQLNVELDSAAELLRNVGIALRALVSRGELDDVLAQLPREMAGILPDVVPHQTP
jgi:uncharacterized protein (DUF2267 family)